MPPPPSPPRLYLRHENCPSRTLIIRVTTSRPGQRLVESVLVGQFFKNNKIFVCRVRLSEMGRLSTRSRLGVQA